MKLFKENAMSKTCLLSIEDDLVVSNAITSYFEDMDFSVCNAHDGEEGIKIFRELRPDIILTDLRLPKIDGLQVISIIKEESPDTPVIVVSGMGTMDDAIKSLKLGTWDYLTKPITDMKLLGHSVSKCLERARLIKENKRYQNHLEEEVKKRTAELHQAQKLEAIGTLAGGIAHDFNNILGAIIGYTDLALLELEGCKKGMEEKLLQIKKAGNRAKDLVAQILTFSRKSQSERMSIELSPIIKEALKLLRAGIPTTIDINQHIENDLLQVLADPTEIHQVIMNLCTNSVHAMKDERGGIDVSLSAIVIDDQQAQRIPKIKTGKYVKLSIHDTGCGMDQEMINHIFDPFFTTKEKGKGTGMGLSVVHGIVSDMGGTIIVNSTPGLGSTISVFFPVSTSQTKTEESVVVSLPKGSERILLVDDEPELVVIGERLLKYLGYSVESFNSSETAIKIFRARPDDFDLIITDQTMPGMPGTELAQNALQVRHNIPIILCTGYSSIITEKNIPQYGIKGYLMKPLSIHKLANEVRRVLKK